MLDPLSPHPATDSYAVTAQRKAIDLLPTGADTTALRVEFTKRLDDFSRT